MAILKKKASSKIRRNRSVQLSITRLFLMTLLIISAVVGVSMYKIRYDSIINESEHDALSAIALAEYSVMDIDFTNTIPAGKYASTRMMLRKICQSQDMVYLSIYYPDETDNSIFYFFCVANSDEVDARIRTIRPYGYFQAEEPITQAEKDALHGDTEPKLWTLNNENGNDFCWSKPIFDYRNKVVAIITAECSVDQLEKETIYALFSVLGLAITLLLIAMVLELILLRKRVFIPLSRISRQMSGFASGSSLNNEPLNIHSQDEIQEIADSFEKMTGDIQVYMANQERATEERAQTKAQLELARNIQYGMVPAAFHQVGASCDVAALMRTAREVGGDFYDCFFRRDGKLCVIMADVSGKGITAALFMAMAKSTFHELLNLGFDPAEALNRANDELCAQNPEGMFVTVFAMIMDIHSGEILLANAGHNPPVIFGNGTSRVFEPAPGIALALFEDSGIENESLTLAPGEGILLYTDGITEAVSIDNKFYGIERLETLLKTPRASAQDLLNDIVLSVNTFAEGTEQFDDMTLAAVLFHGSNDGEEEASHEIPEKEEDISMKLTPADAELSGSLSVSLDSFDTLKEKIRSLTDSSNLNMIFLAAEEAFVNIVDYSGASVIEYVLQKKDRHLTLVLLDDGISFDPFDDRPAKDFDDFDTGGMGISLIRQATEQAGWERKADQNRLTLVFAL